MTGDQLTRELERRSRSVPLYPDWPRDELLPGINSAIDTRPQRVATSRGPALAGLAGVAAILLVLVVALPRIVPGPASTPTPTAGASANPEVGALSPTDFVARLASGELNGETVLVNGQIVVYMGPHPFGPTCSPPPSLCLIGQLNAATNPPPIYSTHVAATEGSGSNEGFPALPWKFWHEPVVPIDGVLVLSIDAVGQVEYVGRVRPRPTSLIATAADAANLDVNTLALDEVVVVDGWLTGNLLVPPCRAPAEGTYIGSLPGRWCGGPDWVVGEPTGFTLGAPIPDGGIAVQDGAYEDFAPNPTQGATVGEPRQGRYLLARRLEGGGCPNDAPPCWQWEVIGRLTDTPSTAPPPSPTRDATPTLATVIDCSQPRPDTQYPAHPIIHDETGLIASCEPAKPSTFAGPIAVANLDGDGRTLQVTWSGVPCDASAQFTFRQGLDGYSLDGQSTWDACDLPGVSFEIRLHIRTEVNADQVRATLRHVELPNPTPTPVDLHGATAMHCAGSDRSVLVLDTSQTATSCSEIPDGDVADVPNGLTVANPDRNESIVQVRWNTSGCVMHVVAAFSKQSGSNLLEISQSDVGCFGRATAIGLTVEFSEPVPADTVQVEFGRLTVGGVQTVTQGGAFDLVIFASAGQVSDGDAIEDLGAYLTFTGDQPVVVTGSGMGLAGPSVQQLGGDLAAAAAMSADCASYELVPEVPTSIPFESTGVMASSNRNHPEFRPIGADHKLVLPPGDWALSMNENFTVGDDCVGTRVSDAAAIIVRVR